MSSYIIRIELGSEVIQDFLILHQEMRKRNFTQTIKNNEGIEYQLPKATYHAISSDRESVLALTKEAVLTTGRSAEILVAQYSACSWSGLKQVR